MAGDVEVQHKPKFAKDKDVEFVNAESSGIFLPVAKHSEYIQQGEIIGRIVNVLTGLSRRQSDLEKWNRVLTQRISGHRRGLACCPHIRRCT
ncbi:MAG: hypothetical protein ACLTDF_08010 [Coprococcus sp.]